MDFRELKSDHVETRLEALQWIFVLLQRHRTEVFFLSFFLSASIFHLLSYIAFSSSGMCSTAEMIKLIVGEKFHRLVKSPSVNVGWPFQW